MLYELVDFGNEFFDTFESSPANRVLGNVVEPNLDLIEPRRISRSIVNLITVMGC